MVAIPCFSELAVVVSHFLHGGGQLVYAVNAKRKGPLCSNWVGTPSKAVWLAAPNRWQASHWSSWKAQPEAGGGGNVPRCVPVALPLAAKNFHFHGWLPARMCICIANKGSMPNIKRVPVLRIHHGPRARVKSKLHTATSEVPIPSDAI